MSVSELLEHNLHCIFVFGQIDIGGTGLIFSDPFATNVPGFSRRLKQTQSQDLLLHGQFLVLVEGLDLLGSPVRAVHLLEARCGTTRSHSMWAGPGRKTRDLGDGSSDRVLCKNGLEVKAV